MVGVDIDQARVETHCTLKERDELAHCSWSDFSDCNRNRLATVLIQCVTGAKVEALQEISGGDAVFNFDRVACAVLEDFDEGGEEVVYASRSCCTYACWSVEPLLP